jgi:hypothetical protein
MVDGNCWERQIRDLLRKGTTIPATGTLGIPRIGQVTKSGLFEAGTNSDPFVPDAVSSEANTITSHLAASNIVRG